MSHRRRAILVSKAIVSRVLVSCRFRERLWVIQNLAKERIRIKQKRCDVLMLAGQVRDKGFNLGIERRDSFLLECRDLCALDGRARRAVDGRDVDEEKIAGARCVQFVHDGIVDFEDKSAEGGGVGVLIGVADVVDADPDREEGGGGLPGDEGFVAVDGEEFILNLLLEIQDSGEVLSDEGGIDCGTAIGEVVGLNARLVVRRGQEVNPVRPIRGGRAWVRRVAERVCRVWLWSSGRIEAGCGVRIATDRVSNRTNPWSNVGLD